MVCHNIQKLQGALLLLEICVKGLCFSGFLEYYAQEHARYDKKWLVLARHWCLHFLQCLQAQHFCVIPLKCQSWRILHLYMNSFAGCHKAGSSNLYLQLARLFFFCQPHADVVLQDVHPRLD